MDGLTTIIVSALVGAVVSALGAMIQNALAVRAKIDESLRGDRVAAYKPLWKMMELLPLWPRATDVTYQKLDLLCRGFRDWYFRVGGLFFSTESRKAYEMLQVELCKVVERSAGRETEVISRGDYDAVRGLCSALRTELTNDLQSRRRSLIFP